MPTLYSLGHVPLAVPEHFCGVAPCIVLLEHQLSSASEGKMGGILCLEGCLGQMVNVKPHPNKNNEQVFHSTTLH